MNLEVKTCMQDSLILANSEKSFNFKLNNENALSNQNDNSLSFQEKLELVSWGLPDRVLEFYKRKRITEMFPWQLECLTLGGVLDAGNLVYSAPTSAGKTLVAEILISKTVFELQKKVLMILPFVSVVREKMFYFQEMYSSSGIHVEGYMGGHSPSVCFKQVHLAICTIEKANSIINRLLEEQALHNLGLVVVDELHLLGDAYRGYLLELLLTKLKFISSTSEFKIQIVGMSATLPNLKSLANWLNADLYYTDFRPVPLNEKLKCGSVIYDKKLNKLSEITVSSKEALDDSENVGHLCLETIANGHSVLIFCPTKVWCENLAEKIAGFFKKNGCDKSAETVGTLGWILRKQLDLQKINEIIEHLKMCPVGLDKVLHKTILYGVAFHHAGLTLDERDIIEGSFRKGSVRVLCATSTLSSGVNLPARRVIIRSPISFGGLMDVLTYRQMIGRAGRMGVDSEGESILICKQNELSMCQTLMNSNLKPIESCLGYGRQSASLKRALLEIIANGIAAHPEEVKQYASCTFLASTTKHDIQDPIQSCIEFLEENEFIRLQENGNTYVPTPLAKACLAASLPPDEGLALFRELQRARRSFVLDTDLHIIYQVTPYSVSEQWNKIDWLNVLNILEGLPPSMKRVGEMVGVEESFLVRVVKGIINPNVMENRNRLSIHRRFYTSLALQDLINEIPLTEVAEKYECNKGMLQSLQQSAATYAGMVTEFTKRLGWGSVGLIFSQFQERLQFGIQSELCELMRLPLLNAMRARALFNAGFTSLSAIANANAIDLENAFFGMAPFQSKKEIAGETSYDKDQRNKMETVWITGKADLTIQQAAELLIAESRKILQLELGLESAFWGKKDTSMMDKSQNKSVGHLILNSLNDSRCKSKCSEEKISLSPPKNIEEKHIKEPLFGINASNREENCDEKYLVEKSNKSIEKNNENVSFHSPQKPNESLNVSEAESVSKLDRQKSFNLKTKSIESKENEKITEVIYLSPTQSILNENPRPLRLESQKDKTDYFSLSLNLDLIPEYDIENYSNEIVNDNNKEVEIAYSGSESNSSVEILYESTMHNASKNLSFSQVCEEIFEISSKEGDGKKMSTPKNPSTSKAGQIVSFDDRSPDLFSQSLTFDTQLGKILDFEEHPVIDVQQAQNPSSSFNSDDLGFVSDMSPTKSNKKQAQLVPSKDNKENAISINASVTVSFLEKGFKSPMEDSFEAVKRKVSAADSPDFIIDSDESMTESQRTSKRLKRSLMESKNSGSSPLIEDDSDDEIMSTPKIEKSHFSNVTKINRIWNTSVRSVNGKGWKKLDSQSHPQKLNTCKANGTNSEPQNCIFMNKFNTPDALVTSEPGNITYDKINIIDVCETEEKFKFFCERLKEQNTIGLALGCRKKTEERKSFIGMNITKRRKIENIKETSKCMFKDIVLDGIAFYWKENDVYYMQLDGKSVPLTDKINLLKNLGFEKKIVRIFDTKEQIKMLQRCCSLLLTCSYQDPKIGLWLLSESWKEKNFSTITLEYLPKSGKLVSLIGSFVGYSSPGLLARSLTSAKTRASLEAFLTYHVITKQLALLRGKGLLKAFLEIEMPIIITLAEMELTGFKLNREVILNLMSKLDEAKEVLEEKAYAIAQHKFSIGSSAAVSKVLYKQLGLEGEAMALTKKRKIPSTSKEALQTLANETKHPLPDIILQWRKIRSISTKFVFPLLQISSDSSHVFGVSQTFTVTGRISMHEPNLQNIPKNFNLYCGEHAETVISIRDAFMASENCMLLSVDYCQIELRMLAHLSQDLKLVNDIKNSPDIFINIASTIFGVPNYDVDDNLRQKAKQTCYGMIYGIGSRNLSLQLEIEESDAAGLLEDFKNKYSGVNTYLEKLISECRKNGFVTTLFGRRRYLSTINDSNQVVRNEAERQAINTTIQGSAADFVKMAMISLRDRFYDLNINGITAHLVLHLHDELIYEIGKDSVEEVAMILKDAMENVLDLSVPTPVKLKIGNSWGQLKSYEV